MSGRIGSIDGVQELLGLFDCCPTLCPCYICMYGVEAEETLQKAFLESGTVLGAGRSLGSKEGLDLWCEVADRVEFGLDVYDGTLLV